MTEKRRLYHSEDNSALWMIEKIRFSQSSEEDENTASYIYMSNWVEDDDSVGSFGDCLTWYPWAETIAESLAAHGYTPAG